MKKDTLRTIGMIIILALICFEFIYITNALVNQQNEIKQIKEYLQIK